MLTMISVAVLFIGHIISVTKMVKPMDRRGITQKSAQHVFITQYRR
jgi:hypothetical protein